MKGYKFYAEMPAHRANKRAANFTRKNLRALADARGYCAVIAVPNPRLWSTTGLLDAFAGESGRGNDPVGGTQVSPDYLRKHCLNVDEATARALHPRLFAYLESPTP